MPITYLKPPASYVAPPDEATLTEEEISVLSPLRSHPDVPSILPFNCDHEIRNLLCRDRFVEWLMGKDDGDVVGMTGDANNCPIQNFLKSHLPRGVSVLVGSTAVSWESHWRSRRGAVGMPRWARTFVSRVDHCNAHTSLTKEDALAFVKGGI